MRLIETIMDDASKQSFNNYGSTLYHGSHTITSPTLVGFRLREKPRDTFILIHNKINEYAIKRFGTPVRNLMFATKDIKQAKHYSHDVCSVIPNTDDYRLFYHVYMDDMTIKTNELLKGIYNKPNFENIFKQSLEHKDTVELLKAINHIPKYVESFDDLDGYVTNILKPYGLESHTKRICSDVRNEILKFSIKYVDDLIETKNPDDIDHQEVMVYAPNGTYLIPV